MSTSPSSSSRHCTSTHEDAPFAESGADPAGPTGIRSKITISTHPNQSGSMSYQGVKMSNTSLLKRPPIALNRGERISCQEAGTAMNNEAESRRFEQAKTAAIGESKAFKMGDAGLEPNSLTIDSAGAYGEHPLEGEAKAEAVSARFDSDDADLAIIVAAWPTLPAERRQTIVGLVMGFEPVEAPPARQNGKQARYVGPDGLIVDGEKSRSRTPRKARR